MRNYKVAAGTSGIARDFRKYWHVESWRAPYDVLFTEHEAREHTENDFIFVREMIEYSVPRANVTVLKE